MLDDILPFIAVFGAEEAVTRTGMGGQLFQPAIMGGLGGLLAQGNGQAALFGLLGGGLSIMEGKHTTGGSLAMAAISSTAMGVLAYQGKEALKKSFSHKEMEDERRAKPAHGHVKG